MYSSDEKNLIDKLKNIDEIYDKIGSLCDLTSNNLEQLKDAEANIEFLIHKETIKSLEKLKKVENEINKIIKEKTIGFPWLADAIAQYIEYKDFETAKYLEEKKHPAIKSAEIVRKIAREKRIYEKKYRISRNFIKYYESLFPWLQEYIDDDIDDLVKQVTQVQKKEETDKDPVKLYLQEAEYNQLSITERNQKALDRYIEKTKSPWELGRDYERYIGYLYEKDGYSVYYQGIEAGLEDLGRDLIAKKDNYLNVIQCKYWSKHKTIREKHICQLFGTTLKYYLEQRKSQHKQLSLFSKPLIKQNLVKGVFITSTTLSNVAKEFADELKIEVREEQPLGKYPLIKCNISKRTGEKIYHLPIDQQYDKTLIEDEKNECYVETVAEAEKLGFRRAWRWRGENK